MNAHPRNAHKKAPKRAYVTLDFPPHPAPRAADPAIATDTPSTPPGTAIGPAAPAASPESPGSPPPAAAPPAEHPPPSPGVPSVALPAYPGTPGTTSASPWPSKKIEASASSTPEPTSTPTTTTPPKTPNHGSSTNQTRNRTKMTLPHWIPLDAHGIRFAHPTSPPDFGTLPNGSHLSWVSKGAPPQESQARGTRCLQHPNPGRGADLRALERMRPAQHTEHYQNLRAHVLAAQRLAASVAGSHKRGRTAGPCDTMRTEHLRVRVNMPRMRLHDG